MSNTDHLRAITKEESSQGVCSDVEIFANKGAAARCWNTPRGSPEGSRTELRTLRVLRPPTSPPEWTGVHPREVPLYTELRALRALRSLTELRALRALRSRRSSGRFAPSALVCGGSSTASTSRGESHRPADRTQSYSIVTLFLRTAQRR